MKAADLKIVKAINEFMREFFPDYGNYNLSSAETSKFKDLEKGDFHVGVDVKPGNVPEILDEENYSTVMKKKLETILKKKIRWFAINWQYHTDPESIMNVDIGFKVADDAN
jgi:hypothetical protein